MAEIDPKKLKKGIMNDLLKQMGSGKDDAFENYASQQAEKAREGKGLIGGALASQKARMEAAREYAIATKGTMGKRQAFFEGLLGRDLGDSFKKLGLEKMESTERIKEAREKFGLDKKAKKEKSGGVGNFAKPISLILRNVIETKKILKNIEKALTKPTIKAGYTFDPRMSGGGRYRNAETNKLVSSKEALQTRTASLTSAIGADEEPLFKLKEYVESKLKDFDAKKMHQATNDSLFSLNGITPTGPISVHDKLNLLLLKSSVPDVGLRTGPGTTGPDDKNKRKPSGRFGKIGGFLKSAAGKMSIAGIAGGMALDYGAGKAEEAGYEKTATGLDIASSTLSGAGTGAMVGSVIPLVGTGIGAVVGGALGAAYGVYKNFGTEEDPLKADLEKYVRKKDASVNLSGLKPQMQERLAGLAYEYNQKTGQKIQINSGYRDSKEQAELYAKYGPPRAAPPGRSRHESGLAVDINSADADKAVQLGLMAKYGFTRPVPGETWHVEPIETAKAPTPDNPYAPGAPVAVANAGGKPANPGTGAKPPAKLIQTTPPAAMTADASTTAPPSEPPPVEPTTPAVASTTDPLATMSDGTPIDSNPMVDAAIEDTGNVSELEGILTDGLVSIASGTGDLSSVKDSLIGMVKGKLTSGLYNALTPKENTMGLDVARQSSELEASKMVAQATPPAPVVVNNNSAASNPQPIQPPKSPLTKALARSAESAFNRAISKDFAHPTAFTSVGLT